MSFARPIDLRAGPTPGTYIFAVVTCIFACVTLLLSTLGLPVKIMCIAFVSGILASSWWSLNRQRGWRIVLNCDGSGSAGILGADFKPACIGQGSFCSRLFVSLPLKITGGRSQYFLIAAGNNGKDDFRHLLVWLNHGTGAEKKV